MTGFGSPCGACKFLRRKCAKGCVFAPYFCHDQGATHFAAIHKVFGASNVSKLLTHLPIADRLEAAVTITYEAQARLQDPIYGCVSHIFALRQQVVNLQAQLAVLRAQATQTLANSSNTNPSELYDRFPAYQQSGNGFFHSEGSRTAQTSLSDPSSSVETMLYCENGPMDQNSMGDYHHSTMTEEHISFATDGGYLHTMASGEMQMDARKWEFQDMEDLQSVAFGHLHYR
ncbi:LOB domain-containing protein 29-like [Magnolia sinica]|uniref:LOB domain-containing protein 29-like n=1 Tax=Magnolia sinica TaxID=86752 RepID=UPI00265B2368|nr:LOB domain-containing protein 29-like [Magnolia sinica]